MIAKVTQRTELGPYLATRLPDMGGHWVDEDMFGSGGMMGGHSHMGDGWQHHNGTYGMAFPFWTAP